ncbi:MAG: hypothetical protein ABIJ61_05195, partial [bacterium]
QAILEAVDKGRPVVVWNVAAPEWGVVIGDDNGAEHYDVLDHLGQPSSLPYAKLGRNGIDILSVLILGDRSGRTREEIVRRSLEAEVRHARGQEWLERPEYQDGLAAFDLWAQIMERGALLAEAGKIGNIGAEIPKFAAYYAEHHYAARCYARDYLLQISADSDLLAEAARCYSQVAARLASVWRFFSTEKPWTASALRELSEQIREARDAEEQAISLLELYLTQ